MKISQLTTVGYPPNFDINIYSSQGKTSLFGILSMRGETPIGLDYVFSVFSGIRKKGISFTLATTPSADNLTQTVTMILNEPDDLENTQYTIKCQFVKGL